MTHRDGLNQVQNVLVDATPGLGCERRREVVKRNHLRGAAEEMGGGALSPEKCRRLWKNCERKLNTSLQMVVLAFATLILKRL